MSVMDEWSRDPREDKEPWERKAVPTLQYYEYTLDEIAEEMGVTRGTVKTYLERAYEKLRRHRELKEWL